MIPWCYETRWTGPGRRLVAGNDIELGGRSSIVSGPSTGRAGRGQSSTRAVTSYVHTHTHATMTLCCCCCCCCGSYRPQSLIGDTSARLWYSAGDRSMHCNETRAATAPSAATSSGRVDINFTGCNQTQVCRLSKKYAAEFLLSAGTTTWFFSAELFFSVTTITDEPLQLARWNFVGAQTLTSARTLLTFKVIGQRWRSHGLLCFFCEHDTAATRERWARLDDLVVIDSMICEIATHFGFTFPQGSRSQFVCKYCDIRSKFQ